MIFVLYRIRDTPFTWVIHGMNLLPFSPETGETAEIFLQFFDGPSGFLWNQFFAHRSDLDLSGYYNCCSFICQAEKCLTSQEKVIISARPFEKVNYNKNLPSARLDPVYGLRIISV